MKRRIISLITLCVLIGCGKRPAASDGALLIKLDSFHIDFRNSSEGYQVKGVVLTNPTSETVGETVGKYCLIDDVILKIAVQEWLGTPKEKQFNRLIPISGKAEVILYEIPSTNGPHSNRQEVNVGWIMLKKQK